MPHLESQANDMIKLTAMLWVGSWCSCSFPNPDPRMLEPKTTPALEERRSKVAERSFIVLLACLIICIWGDEFLFCLWSEEKI